jgi:hypothetical protein
MITQGYQDIKDVARKREFTGKMIAGIKNDTNEDAPINFSRGGETDQRLQRYHRNDNNVCVLMK